MFSSRLEAISKDPDNPDSIAHLVVTALGNGGSFYICWKTRAGNYEQDSHGLPSELEKWLFSPQDCNRDFETLQVILGPGEGEYIAQDCNEKITHLKPTLERAATFRSLDGSPSGNAPSETEKPADEYEIKLRRRSQTLSAMGWDANSRRSSPAAVGGSSNNNSSRIIEPEQRQGTSGKLRRLSLVPLAMRIGRPTAPRPQSIDHGNTPPRPIPVSLKSPRNSSAPPSLGDMPPQRYPNNLEPSLTSRWQPQNVEALPMPQRHSQNFDSTPMAQRQSSKLDAHPTLLRAPVARRKSNNFETPPNLPRAAPMPRRQTHGSDAPSVSMLRHPKRTSNLSISTRTACTYVDVGVQTTPPPPPKESAAAASTTTITHGHRSGHHHHRKWSCASGSSSESVFFETDYSPKDSRRSSIMTDITNTSKYYWPEEQQYYYSNPIMMGRMTDYFRSYSYQLGDSLGWD